MHSLPEVEQLDLLARVDELIHRLRVWADEESAWEPLAHSRALVRRLLSRVEHLRIRLESPLVVATFGGTGTGKSTLVNALVGQEVTQVGRQRPTTTRPILVLHPSIDPESLGLPLDDFEIARVDAPILRDIVLVDCPDPDTTEVESPGTNLERLHRLLPHCDVLLYTSTQQKYRSDRVMHELGQAAAGCRLLFVQTHADLDEDIRDDWKTQLSPEYEVPEMFFLDSQRALAEQRAGLRPTGDFGRLMDVIAGQLAASQRIKIRRANLIDLIAGALEHCREHIGTALPEVERLQGVLNEQRVRLTQTMAAQLRRELLMSRNLWERRLLAAVTQIWGFSPFSSVLRFYNGMGSLIASLGMYRARNTAQLALIGVVSGARWMKSRQAARDADEQLDRLATFALDDNALQEVQFIIAGYARSARLDVSLAGSGALADLRQQAVRAEGEFLTDARRRIDEIIDHLAVKNSRWPVRWFYELLFLAYLLFVLFRVGKNFFYDTFWLELMGNGTGGEALLSLDFYVAAGIFFVLWSGLLVMAFTRRLRRGLNRYIEALASELAQGRIANGIFPKLEKTCRQVEQERTRLEALAESAAAIRRQIAGSTSLGARREAVLREA